VPIKQDRGISQVALELKDLTVAYAKQETVEPIKLLGRYIALGIAGSLLIGIGLILLTFAGVRALQTETGTALTGNWSWVPYLAAIVFLAIVMAIFARVISRQPKSQRKRTNQ
jgi:Putative Actinobacterial Holin-X, holin superfamily III